MPTNVEIVPGPRITSVEFVPSPRITSVEFVRNPAAFISPGAPESIGATLADWATTNRLRPTVTGALAWRATDAAAAGSSYSVVKARDTLGINQYLRVFVLSEVLAASYTGIKSGLDLITQASITPIICLGNAQGELASPTNIATYKTRISAFLQWLATTYGVTACNGFWLDAFNEIMGWADWLDYYDALAQTLDAVEALPGYGGALHFRLMAPSCKRASIRYDTDFFDHVWEHQSPGPPLRVPNAFSGHYYYYDSGTDATPGNPVEWANPDGVTGWYNVRHILLNAEKYGGLFAGLPWFLTENGISGIGAGTGTQWGGDHLYMKTTAAATWLCKHLSDPHADATIVRCITALYSQGFDSAADSPSRFGMYVSDKTHATYPTANAVRVWMALGTHIASVTGLPDGVGGVYDASGATDRQFLLYNTTATPYSIVLPLNASRTVARVDATAGNAYYWFMLHDVFSRDYITADIQRLAKKQNPYNNPGATWDADPAPWLATTPESGTTTVSLPAGGIVLLKKP